MTRMPQVTARDLVRFLRSQGFIEDRQSGSVTIPIHTGADIGRGLAVRILKDAGFTVDEFVRLGFPGAAKPSPRSFRT